MILRPLILFSGTNSFWAVFSFCKIIKSYSSHQSRSKLQVGKTIKPALALIILLLLLLPAGARDGEGMRVVPAQEILDKIERGEPVEYDHVIVEGDLDLGSWSCRNGM